MGVGRNDPCPCGSGVKYKRCCLDRELELAHLVAELEEIVSDVGDAAFEHERKWWLERLADFYDGGYEAFGLAGPSPDELFEAYLWFALDCPLPDGNTPLESFWVRSSSRSAQLLARSELRVWRVESSTPNGMLAAACPITGERASLGTIRYPFGQPESGELLVARSVPVGPERWVLLGDAPIVEPEVQAEFEAMLASLSAPAGAFWRVHGGVIAHAAWAWPEEREVTVDGEIVQSTIATFKLMDPEEVIRILDLDPSLAPREPDPFDGAKRWSWRWSPPEPDPPAPEPGVRYTVCPEDLDPEPWLAEVTVRSEPAELFLYAATRSRWEHAEGLLSARLARLLEPGVSPTLEPAERLPRWKRFHVEDAMDDVARRYQRPPVRAAA